ncbi:MAG: HEPN domain-containing protein [Candidatus Terrybacteria bacterium]|nr:HEPN domain-containing protein [Candidatus Terrybacteria bacterium]
MKQDFQKNIKYWLDGSKRDLQVAENLFKSKYYPQCLFFCHLSLEKFLKALVIKTTKDYPPFIHDLRRLAEIANIKLDSRQKQILDKISTFNIAGRYADDKFEFYKKFNKKEYAEKYLKLTEEMHLWLKK